MGSPHSVAHAHTVRTQTLKHTTIQYIGDNGELVVINPSKQGKDSHRLFKFNKVFGPATTQGSNFLTL